MEDLSKLKLEELTNEELLNIEGGRLKWWQWLLIGLTIGGLAGEAVF
ncbi:MAG: class IIb bacteriocin, lactobin A/cerein 7B family [Ekhidna sp.]|nr:class IIb bacteriocin, lactobin A/cerein 7B family [Ekhidna sp.]